MPIKKIFLRFSPQRSPYIWAWLFSVAVLFTLFIVRLTKDPALIGEEMATYFRNPIFFWNRTVSDGYATTYSQHLFFALVNKLLPLTIHTGQIVSVLMNSLIGPIGLWLYRLIFQDASRLSQILVVALLSFNPVLAWYGVIVPDFNGALVQSMALVALALDRRTSIWIYVFLFAFCLHWYAGNLPALALSLALMANRLRWSRQAAFALIGLIVLCSWPLIYYTHNVTFLRGGGSGIVEAGPDLELALRIIKEDLFTRGSSYLLAGYSPFGAFDYRGGGFLVLLSSLIGIWAHRRHKITWAIVATIIVAIGMSSFIWPNPGIRRGLFGIVLLILLAGRGVDGIKLKFLKRIMICGFLTASVVLFGLQIRHTRQEYSAWLQRRFTNLPGLTYPESIEYQVEALARQTLGMSDTEYALDYVLMFKQICERRHGKCKPLQYQGYSGPTLVFEYLTQ